MVKGNIGIVFTMIHEIPLQYTVNNSIIILYLLQCHYNFYSMLKIFLASFVLGCEGNYFVLMMLNSKPYQWFHFLLHFNLYKDYDDDDDQHS